MRSRSASRSPCCEPPWPEAAASLLQTILARCRSRTEVAVTFLATLELVRRREVRAEQDELFGPILVEIPS